MSLRDKRAARESRSSASQWETWPIKGALEVPQYVPDGLVGMPVEDAARLANEAGWLVRALGPGAWVTLDLSPTRLNLNFDETNCVVSFDVG